MNEALIGVLGAIFGGAGLKLVEGYFLKGQKKIDIATEIREELREEIRGYKNEVSALRIEVDNWKRVYFRLLEIIIKHNIDIPDDLLIPGFKTATPNPPSPKNPNP